MRCNLPNNVLAASLMASLLVTACAGRQGKAVDEQSAADKFYDLGLASFQGGMLDDARLQADKALRFAPEHAEAHYLLGLIALQQGKAMVDSLESESCLRDDAAKLSRQRADELHRKAHAEFERASRAFGEKDAGFGRSLNSMAVVSLYFRDAPRAIAEAERALTAEFYGERYSALANLGWAHFMRGDDVQAITELRQAVLQNPGYCVGRYRLAQVYLHRGQVEAAQNEIRQVVADARCPIQDAHRVMGVALMQSSEVADAAESFEACIATAPQSCLSLECGELLQSLQSLPAAG